MHDIQQTNVIIIPEYHNIIMIIIIIIIDIIELLFLIQIKITLDVLYIIKGSIIFIRDYINFVNYSRFSETINELVYLK